MIQPYEVIEEINKLSRGEAIISTGVGQHQMWAAQYFDYKEPRLWLTSGSMGTMGFGLPAAIGAQFAKPNTLVIDIDGDASIRMNIGELETATTYDLPIKVLVLNNYGDGMVRQWQKLYYKSEIKTTVKKFIEFDGPAFLEVIIDPDAGVYPMVGPGQTYDKMITGDWIKNRNEIVDEELDKSSMF